MQYLLKAGAEVNKRCGFYHPEQGRPPLPALTVASESVHFDAVRLLCESGANKDLRSESDSGALTPLGAATKSGHVEIVQYLRDQGAEICETPVPPECAIQ